MSDKAKYGYLAGIIDGEGSITITKTYNRARVNSDGNNSVAYMSVLSVRNTDFKLIKWLMDKFGGTYYKDNNRTESWKAAYRWCLIKQKDQELLLLAILPYLLLKKEQANIVLQFIRMNGGRNPELREIYHRDVLLLNRRGEIVETNTLDSVCDLCLQDKSNHFNNGQCRTGGGSFTPKIESELIGNNKSAPVVIQNA